MMLTPMTPALRGSPHRWSPLSVAGRLRQHSHRYPVPAAVGSVPEQSKPSLLLTFVGFLVFIVTDGVLAVQRDIGDASPIVVSTHLGLNPTGPSPLQSNRSSECLTGSSDQQKVIVLMRSYVDLTPYTSGVNAASAVTRCRVKCSMHLDWCSRIEITTMSEDPIPHCRLYANAATFRASGYIIPSTEVTRSDATVSIDNQTWLIICGVGDSGGWSQLPGGATAQTLTVAPTSVPVVRPVTQAATIMHSTEAGGDRDPTTDLESVAAGSSNKPQMPNVAIMTAVVLVPVLSAIVVGIILLRRKAHARARESMRHSIIKALAMQPEMPPRTTTPVSRGIVPRGTPGKRESTVLFATTPETGVNLLVTRAHTPTQISLV